MDPHQPSWLYVIDGNIWVAGGKVPQQLTTDGGVSQPNLGDGGLAFVERNRNASDIWLASSDAPPRAITRFSAPSAALSHWASQPQFVPGRQRLYVVGDLNKASTGPGDLAIWEVSLDKSQPLQITRPPAYSGGDQDVTINPEDPRQIVFTRYAYVGAQLVEQLQWLDVTTNRLVALTQDDQAARQAGYSPDGSEIAFVQHDSGIQENLYVATLDVTSGRPQLGNPRAVATGMIANPMWSPDGAALAYVALTPHGFQLFSVAVTHDANGDETFGPPKQLTEGPSIDATSRPVFLTLEQADDIRDWLAAPAF
jgi:Tol biopolymer transport system component